MAPIFQGIIKQERRLLLKGKLLVFLALILVLCLGISQIQIKVLEETISLSREERVTLVLYRKAFSKYGNTIEIRRGQKSTWKKFQGKNSLNIWKLCLGDVDGDGEVEIALGVYKKAPHHQVMARRPFLYNIRDGELQAKFRASRLSLPMEDFTLYDIDKDGREEILSVERRGNQYFLAAYHYSNFHISRDYLSRPLEEKPLLEEKPGWICYQGETQLLEINGKEIVLP